MPARAKKNHHPQKSQSKTPKKGGNAVKKGSFRVIAGELRSRRFEFPVIEGLRPTTDRVKETVFNWLQMKIPGARVLDLFAGSGSLSFEAYSRGAEFVLMLEKNKTAANSIKQNLEIVGAKTKNAEVKCVDSLTFLENKELPETFDSFDIVLIDPPFRKDMLQTVFTHLTTGKLLAQKAFIYVEHEKEAGGIQVPDSWTLVKEKEAGQVAYLLYQYESRQA